MPLFLRRSSDAGTVRVAGGRDRRALIKSINKRVAKLDPGESSSDSERELQILIQVCGPQSYTAFRAARERAWRKQNAPWATGGWPTTIGPNEAAGLLLTLPAGRVGPAVGKHPRSATEPLFMAGHYSADGTADELALALLKTWVEAQRSPVALAPPVVETMRGREAAERRVVDFGVTWRLPIADGV